jgi:hypothetical protein
MEYQPITRSHSSKNSASKHRKTRTQGGVLPLILRVKNSPEYSSHCDMSEVFLPRQDISPYVLMLLARQETNERKCHIKWSYGKRLLNKERLKGHSEERSCRVFPSECVWVSQDGIAQPNWQQCSVLAVAGDLLAYRLTTKDTNQQIY